MRDTIAQVLQELYDYKEGSGYRYRKVLSKKVCLIDPAVETAKEAYLSLRQLNSVAAKENTLHSTSRQDAFFIAVPNLDLPDLKLQSDGWFTYEYKYGRNEGADKKYVQFVPFDIKNISPETYERFRRALPLSYGTIMQVGIGSQIR
jgi:hypothetical protein